MANSSEQGMVQYLHIVPPLNGIKKVGPYVENEATVAVNDIATRLRNRRNGGTIVATDVKGRILHTYRIYQS